MKPREIVGRIEAKFGVHISYMKAWDARRKAIRAIFGSWEESYRSLYRFMDAVCTAMPGSVYRVCVSGGSRFRRVFWSFGPSIAGWAHCRPVLCLDGTFLLGKYRGTLLTAIGIDANNGLFPLAFAVVEAESVDSWIWFMQCIRDCIALVSSRTDLCIISDRHAGLIRGCTEVLPWATHRHCLRHLRENFKKAVRQMGIPDSEAMSLKMYGAGNTDDVRVFRRFMTDIRNVKEAAYNWLMERDPQKWTQCQDGGLRYGTMTTNAAESFNGVLRRARALPMQALICSIYYNIVALFMKRHNTATMLIDQGDSCFAPRASQILKRYEAEVRRFPTPTRINMNEYEVFDAASRAFTVTVSSDVDVRCSCNRPLLYHMTCAHVIAAMAIGRLDYQNFVSPYYSVEAYKATYDSQFHVIPEKTHWRDYNTEAGLIELLPPAVRRRPGRPRTQRIRNTMDEGGDRTGRFCSICSIAGHNRSTCPQNPANIRFHG